MIRGGEWRRLGVAVVLAGVVAGCPVEQPSPVAESAESGLQEKAGFHDEAIERGFDFRFMADRSEEKRIYEALGGGVILFDADGDLDLDLFMPGGGSGAATPDATTHQQLFVNDGSGRFRDATARSGLTDARGDYAVGGAAGDVDGDGDMDLYVTTLGRNRLYLNDGSGRFEPVADAGGAESVGWSTSAVLFDADGDADLDLYVVSYLAYDRDEELPCTLEGRRIYCTPDLFYPAQDRLFRNDGGRFVDVSEEAGISGLAGNGLAVVAADLDRDLDLDLYVANDITPNFLWINDGRGHFLEDGLLRGAALSRDGREEAGMGVVAADFDNDRQLDLAVTNFSSESHSFYRQDAGFFTESSKSAGLGRSTAPHLGFGIAAGDFDLDGWIDLLYAGGHVNDLADELLVGVRYHQPNLLLRNHGGTFEAWPDLAGDLARPNLGRGLATGDLDGDGDLDVVISRLDGPAGLFIARGSAGHRWLALRPLTAAGHGAFGARVLISQESGRTQERHLAAGGSYASQSEPIIRFGLGAAPDRVTRLIVEFPSGARLQMEDPPDGQVITIREPV